MCFGEVQHIKQGEQLLAPVVQCYSLPVFSERSRYNNPNEFYGWDLRNSLKIGWKTKAYLGLQEEAPKDSFKQGEDTAGLQLFSTSPTLGKDSFPPESRNLPFVPPDAHHIHSPLFSTLTYPRACELHHQVLLPDGFCWVQPVECTAGEIWAKEESKIKVYVFSVPSLWLCPSPEGHSPSHLSVILSMQHFLSGFRKCSLPWYEQI